MPMTVDALTDDVLGWERGHSSIQRTRPEIREQLCVTDLPALDRAGVLTFDGDRGIVGAARTTIYPQSGAAVERPGSVDRSGHLIPQVVGVVLAVGLFVLTVIDAAPLAAVPPTAAVGVSLVAFAALAAGGYVG